MWNALALLRTEYVFKGSKMFFTNIPVWFDSHCVFGEIFKLYPDYKADMLQIPVDVRMEQTWFKFLKRQKVWAQGPR